MNPTDGVVNHANGWLGGSVWIWVAAAILIVAFLVLTFSRLSKKYQKPG